MHGRWRRLLRSTRYEDPVLRLECGAPPGRTAGHAGGASGSRDRAGHVFPARCDAARPRTRWQHGDSPRIVRPDRDRHGPPSLAQRRHPRVREEPQPADRRHSQHSLASRSLERQSPREGRVSAGEGLHDHRGRSRDRPRRVPDTQCGSRTRAQARSQGAAHGAGRDGAISRDDGRRGDADGGCASGALGTDDPCRAASRDARHNRRRHRQRSLALRRGDARRGHWRSRDAARAVFRNGLPGTLAERAGRGVGHAVYARGARTWRADEPRSVRHLPESVRQLPFVRRLGQGACGMRGGLDQGCRTAARLRRRSTSGDRLRGRTTWVSCGRAAA